MGKKTLAFILFATIIAALCTGCFNQGQSEINYNQLSDLPEGTTLLLLVDVKYDNAKKQYCVTAKAGREVVGSPQKIGENEYTLPLSSDTDFSAHGWDPGVDGLSSMTEHTSAENFYTNWFMDSKKYGYTETAFQFAFNEEGKINYLFEYVSNAGVPEVPTSEQDEEPTNQETSDPPADDYDLPVSEVPELVPDILKLREVQYDENPTFSTQNEVTKYVLHNFLNNRFEFEFYLDSDFAVDEGTGHGILNRACEAAMTYYLFSAYNEFDMYTEYRDEEGKAFARIKLIYTNPDYDLEARAEAMEFVFKNPVPSDGFKDFETEKAYAKKIHDFIAKKVTYSSIGYDPVGMLGLEKYESLQEAYNVLAEDQNTVVCAGYARAFALIAHYAGINTAWVFGNETDIESHAWNVIYPCDGSEPVVVDVTWDDTGSDDFPGQEYVDDSYFYLPLSEDTQHTAADHFEEFLQFVNS